MPYSKRDKEADRKRTLVVKKMYERIFEKKWPKGWDIFWHVQGVCIHSDEAIYLAADSLRDPYDVETALHEMLHMERPEMRHGKKFDAKVREMLRRVGVKVNK